LDFILPLELAPDVTPALVAKRSILYLFPFGPAAWLCGGIFINRGKGQQCRTAISTTAKELHKKKVRLNEEIFSDGSFPYSVFPIAHQYEFEVSFISFILCLLDKNVDVS
jgi:1-acyl-sn-glycerol-3-phosphate acyltransferase